LFINPFPNYKLDYNWFNDNSNLCSIYTVIIWENTSNWFNDAYIITSLVLCRYPAPAHIEHYACLRYDVLAPMKFKHSLD
jgi:hypothetical protein